MYCTLTLGPSIWENDINLWVTKIIKHCKIKGPQSRPIKATITVVNTVSTNHPSPKIGPSPERKIIIRHNFYLTFHVISGFPGGSEVKVSASNAGDRGSIPGLGRSPGEGNGNPLQYSCLENPMDGGAW